MPKITFIGHACFLLEEEGKETLVFDPFIKDNPHTELSADDIKADFVLVTHAHFDHMGEACEIAKSNDATIITTAEIAGDVEGKGCKAHPLHIGGKNSFPFGWVKATLAFHGSGIAGGHACGFVVNYYGKNIYFAGDTGLFGDMKIIGETMPLDLALLPIGDNFTMGIDDAVMAVDFLKPKHVVPYHYNTWPYIEADPQEFKKKVEEKTSSGCTVVPAGESFTF